MVNIPTILSFVFFFICFFYFFLGIYILYINPKENINKMFFAICISLFIWSFGASIAISAPDIETCLFWKRVSALGWGTLICEMLYYIMLLTEKRGLLKKWWSYLIALPGVVIIYIFSLSSRHALIQYKLVYTASGWMNIEFHNLWYTFFYAYYFSGLILGIAMLWHWKIWKRNNKKYERSIFCAFIIAFIIETIITIFKLTIEKAGISTFAMYFPQIEPIIMLIPTISIYYSITKHQFMNIKPFPEEEMILSVAYRDKIYKHLSTVFILGSFLFFISQYFISNDANLTYALVSSAVLLVFGVSIRIVQNLNLKENQKCNIVTIAVVISIPIITLEFINIGSITVWAVPFIFIISSLLLNKTSVLMLISISIIATQILVWFLAPQVIVTIDSSDHAVRMGIYSIAIWMAFFVNRIYILRLREHVNQVKFQTLISYISTSFVTINMTNFDDKINLAIRKCRKYFQVDIASMAIFDRSHGKVVFNRKWRSTGNFLEPELFIELSIDNNVWWIKQLLEGEIVQIQKNENQMDLLSSDDYIGKRREDSILLIPIIGKSEVLGFLEFSIIKTSKYWRNDNVNRMAIISKIFADALGKVIAEKEINYMAYYDQLTKLPNRILFKDRVDQAIHLANRTEKMLGIVFLDLDSFNSINDTIGHEGGDILLRRISKQLSQCLRKTDTVCRFAGDEFIIMLNHISERDDIARIVSKILRIFNQVFMLNGQEFFISASAGISIYPEDGDNTEALIKNANIAMYQSKSKGKNQYTLCSEEMKKEIHTKIKLTNSLYRAKERNELFLHYQPQICLETMKINGVEALLRWKHPKYGMIPPSQFIPLAEQTGAINHIGEWALETACHQNKLWQDLGLPPIRMAVNLSVNQFSNPKLVDQIDHILKKTGLNPEYLELEITESITIKEEEYIVSVLNRLKELGVTISIDDFGTEYSSLSRLKILPVDRIKIDMQFISGIEKNDKDRVITDSIINLARKLGLNVVAEGVETEIQLEFLNQRMCNEAQGYYLHRPMPSEAIEAIMKIK